MMYLLLTVPSVQSSQWGDYKGTLIGVSHLDLINWTNRLKWFFWELTGSKRKYEGSSPSTKSSLANADAASMLLRSI